jgi:broad specificity phosphatase PhoE
VTRILLARHGETDWNRDNRFQGHADPPLNDAGREQAAALAASLAGERVAAVYSSPLRRAFETAELVAAPHRLEPTTVDALREVDVGSWQGLTRTEIESRFPEQFHRWLAFGQGWEDGETYEEMGVRVIGALSELSARHDGERVVVLTHGGPIRAAIAAASGISHSEARRREPVVGNCVVVEVDAQDGILRRVD